MDSTQTISVRHVMPRDYNFLMEAFREVSLLHRDAQPQIYPEVKSSISQWKYLAWLGLRSLNSTRLGSHDRVGLIATMNEKRVGVLYGEALDSNWRLPGLISLEQIWVDPNERRQGVGRALGSEFGLWAKAHGYYRLTSAILVGNQPMQEFLCKIFPDARPIQNIWTADLKKT